MKQRGAHWYLMGRKGDGSFDSYALIRIQKLRLTGHKFQLEYDECVKLCEEIADFF